MNNFVLRIKNALLPGADGIMKSFNSAITSLEAKADASSELSQSLAAEAYALQEEADRAHKLAIKLKSAFTI